jgi:hypothetical protein
MPPIDDTTANGQSDGEYATVILRICGVKEEWSQPEPGKWVSSVREMREALEQLVRLIKRRTVKNVNDHERAERAIGTVDTFLRQQSERAER